MNAEDRSVPLVNELMRRILESALNRGIVLQPRSTAEVPVGEPSLFGLCVLCLEVVNTIVCNESLETLVVVSCQPINAEAAKTCTYAAQTVLVNVWKLASIVDSALVVIHASTCVVGGNLFEPFLTESWQAAAVRTNHDIAVGSHDLHVPAIAPELADRALRTTLAEEQGRVLLVSIEARRKYNPREDVLAIHRLASAWLHIAPVDIVTEVLVLVRELSGIAFLHIHKEVFLGFFHRLASTKQFFATESHVRVIILPISDFLHLSLQVGAIHMRRTMPSTHEVKCLVVVCPSVSIHITVKLLSDVCLLACL